MLRIIKPGGRLVLMFPDFAIAGRLGSQMLGLSLLKTARDKVMKGKLCDALISFYDSRIRLPRALRDAVLKCGPFPVNLNPACLKVKDVIGADMDVVYISSKIEISEWATANGNFVEFPFGTEGDFAEMCFMSIIKKRTAP